MKNVNLKPVIVTLKGVKKSGAQQRIAESIFTKISKTTSQESARACQALLTTINPGLTRSKSMSSTQKKSLCSPKTGAQSQRTVQKSGTKESLTSSLSEERKKLKDLSAEYRKRKNSSSMTGKLAGYIPTMTIRNPFTVSQLSPNSLLCSACGRSTYTLTSDKSGRKPFIVTRCTNCGQRGMIVPESFSKLLKIRKE